MQLTPLFINCFKNLLYVKWLCFLTVVNKLSTNTLTVGRSYDDPTTPITITPTPSRPVQLKCGRIRATKNWWYNNTLIRSTRGSVFVTPTYGYYTEPAITLSILQVTSTAFSTFSCEVYQYTSYSTYYTYVTYATYPVVLGM